MVLYQQQLSFQKEQKISQKENHKIGKSKQSNARYYRKPASPFQDIGVSGSKPVWSTGAVAMVDAAVPPESHTACSLTAVCPLSAESWETASLMREDVPDTPQPMPLLFLILILNGTIHFALFDSGASDSFISAIVVKQAGLRPVTLQEPIRVRVANGQSLDVLHFVRLPPLTDGGVPLTAAVQPHNQLEKKDGADHRGKEYTHNASGASLQRPSCSLVRRQARRFVTGDASLGLEMGCASPCG